MAVSESAMKEVFYEDEFWDECLVLTRRLRTLMLRRG